MKKNHKWNENLMLISVVTISLWLHSVFLFYLLLGSCTIYPPGSKGGYTSVKTCCGHRCEVRQYFSYKQAPCLILLCDFHVAVQCVFFILCEIKSMTAVRVWFTLATNWHSCWGNELPLDWPPYCCSSAQICGGVNWPQVWNALVWTDMLCQWTTGKIYLS